MKIPIWLFLLGLFLCQGTIAQQVTYPRNLKTAVKILMIDCPDTLKTLIVKTRNDSLIYLCYPWGGKYKTINEWFSNGETLSPIDKYLIKKGFCTYKEQHSIVLTAFKQKLVDGKVNQKLIFMQYEKNNGEKINSKKQKIRYTTEIWEGKYIPKDIDDAIIHLDILLGASLEAKYEEYKKEDFNGLYNFTFGMWIRNNWQLWNGSRLSKYFNSLGIYNADDMSSIILDSYKRHLQMKEINLNQQIQDIKKFNEDARISESERRKYCFAEYLIGDTVELITTRPLNKNYRNPANYNPCHPKGIIISMNQEEFMIKVKLIENCENKRIAYYILPEDQLNKKYVYNHRYLFNRKRENIFVIRKGQMEWFKYHYWNLKKNNHCA